MRRSAIVVGILLILLGVIFYVATGAVSVTALIPSFFGIVLVLLGWLARNEKWNKHLMHAAMVVALIGAIGALRAVPQAFLMIAGQEVKRPGAVVEQLIMLVILVYFLVAGIRSFIAARKKAQVSSGGDTR